MFFTGGLGSWTHDVNSPPQFFTEGGMSNRATTDLDCTFQNEAILFSKKNI